MSFSHEKARLAVEEPLRIASIVAAQRSIDGVGVLAGVDSLLTFSSCAPLDPEHADIERATRAAITNVALLDRFII